MPTDPVRVAALVARAFEALGIPYLVGCDEELVRDAAREKRLVNVIHLPTMVKADLHVRPDEGIYASEMERAVRASLGGVDGPGVRVASPEDTLLQKLRWFERGGRASDRQWRDVLGILKAIGPRLDRAYLERWAHELGLTALLGRASAEAGIA